MHDIVCVRDGGLVPISQWFGNGTGGTRIVISVDGAKDVRCAKAAHESLQREET